MVHSNCSLKHLMVNTCSTVKESPAAANRATKRTAILQHLNITLTPCAAVPYRGPHKGCFCPRGVHSTDSAGSLHFQSFPNGVGGFTPDVGMRGWGFPRFTSICGGLFVGACLLDCRPTR